MKDVKYLGIIIFIGFFWPKSILAQQGNVWAFGYHSGLNFNFKPPKLISTAIHYANVSPDEGPVYTSSSISDCRGQLLFYGSNAEIYNRFNKIMPHGHLNFGNGTGTVYIVPFTNDTSKYYYFHQMDGFGVGGEKGLVYSIVDMTLDSGRGDVDLSTFETKLNPSPYAFTVIKNRNDTDSWIISPVNNDTFYIYPLTAKGIGTPRKQPKISFTCDLYAKIRGNHKGDRVAIMQVKFSSNTYGSVQYSFDNSFGVFSKPQIFFDRTPTLNNRGDYIDVFGADYSANDSFLYFGAIEINSTQGNWESRIYQSETYSNPGSTMTLLNKGSGIFQLIGFQLGPDNAMYVGLEQDSFLSIIKNPDKKGTACNYMSKILDVRPGSLGTFLPNIYSPVRHLKFQGSNKANGCADSIHFTNLSDTIYFKSFKWYFGDPESVGTGADSSTKYAPWHAYKKPGKYNVLLVGINGCGAKLYYSDSVEIHLPAHAGFKTDTITYTCQQAKLTLHNIYKDTTQTFAYSFGDSTGWFVGNPAMKDAKHRVSTNHTYAKAGTYTVAQAVSNAASGGTGGCQDTLRQTVTINIEPRPKSGFSVANTAQCKPYQLQIKNTSQKAYKYLWSTPAPAPKGAVTDTASNALSLSVFLASADSGYHKISLVASNHQGCADTFTMPGAVYISQRPAPVFTYTQKILCGAIEADFTNNSKFSNKYAWLFTSPSGNTVSDTAKSPTHKFINSGTYHVTLVSQNSYCQDTSKQDIKIDIPLIKANFTATNTKGCPGLKASFNNQSTFGGQPYKGFGNVIGFQWDFGDPASAGNTDTAAAPSHVYLKAGAYTVRLIATSPQGCRDTFWQKNYINILPYPKAALAVHDSTVLCAAFRYGFKNLSANADSFVWNFGDGSALVVVNTDNGVAHTYKTNGDYKVTIKAGNGFCLDSSAISIGIRIRPLPAPNFKADTDIVCLGTPIRFKNNSTGADSVLWSYGDGSQKDTAQNPTHTYARPGRYNISLVAKSKEGCAVTLQKTSFVQVADTFSVRIKPAYSEGCAPLSVPFATSSISKDLPLYYYWDFGDPAKGGTGPATSTLQNPVHIFQKNGIYIYKVKLVVTNKYCSDSATATVRVKNLDALQDTVIMRLATVDNDAYAHIYWQKHPLAVNYALFRSTDGIQYEPVAYITDTAYTDRRVNVHAQSYWYKVTGLDACGGTSAISREATTIFLSGKSANEDAVCNLAWNNYRQFRFGLKDYGVIKDHLPLSPVFVNNYTDNDFFSETVTGHQYQVVASENNGVNGNDTLKSYSNILKLPLKSRLWIPNAFSPNNDNTNDSFWVRATGIASYHIAIYNRWGERVFESNDILEKWGLSQTRKGEPGGRFDILEGIYIYMIEAKSGTGELIYKKGNITVIK